MCERETKETPAMKWAEEAQQNHCDIGRPMEPRSIGWAVKQMYAGIPVRRSNWNGRGMSIQIQLPCITSKMTQPYVFIRTVQGDLIPWLCSQADLLATDWEPATV